MKRTIVEYFTRMEQVELIGEDRIVLSGISWELYEQLRENEDNWHVRMAYDSGRLELMSPSPDREAVTKLVARMIEALTAELGIPLRSLRSTKHGRRRNCSIQISSASMRSAVSDESSVARP